VSQSIMYAYLFHLKMSITFTWSTIYCSVLQQILCVEVLMLCALLFWKSLQEKL